MKRLCIGIVAALLIVVFAACTVENTGPLATDTQSDENTGTVVESGSEADESFVDDFNKLLEAYEKDKATTTLNVDKYNVQVSFVLLDDASYDVVNEDSTYIKIFLDDEKQNNIAIQVGPFGVCGTGLQIQEFTFDDRQASKGQYIGNEFWEFISFADPEFAMCNVLNQSSAEWYQTHLTDISKLLNSIHFEITK